MSNNCWPELHAGRMEWALRGYQSFVDSIDPELKQDYRRDDQITLVVYGSTQVGKTSLILNLLGIAETDQQRVAGLLRGGQTAGKSATATATRYRRSRDQYWYLGTALCRPLGDEDVCAELKDLRKQMECGGYEDAGVLDIHIPCHYFDPDRRGDLDVRLIDLPGLNARNENERKHVSRLANKYVPLADLIILTVKAEQLGELHPDALQLEALKDWMIQPRRFRIVLTFSYSCQSFIDQFNPGLDAQGARDRAFNECCTHDYPMREEIRQYLYPLEFGDSWNDLRRNKPDYFEQVQPIARQLMFYLIESLRGAANPYARLQAILDLHRVAQERIRQRESAHKVRSDQLLEQIRELRELHQQTEQLRKGLASQAQNLDALLSRLNSAQQRDALRKAITQHFPPTTLYFTGPDENTESLIDAAESHLAQLEALWRQLPHTALPDAIIESGLYLQPGRAPQPKGFAEFYRALRGYLLETYFPTLSSDYEKDVNRLKQLCREANLDYRKSALHDIETQIDKWRKTERQKLARWDEQIERLARKMVSVEEQVHATQNELTRRKQEFERFRLRMEQTVEQCRQFQLHMRAAHEDEASSLRNRYRDEPDAAMRFYLLALLELHQPELDRMMESLT